METLKVFIPEILQAQNTVPEYNKGNNTALSYLTEINAFLVIFDHLITKMSVILE